jgi:hypothetical protein
MLKIQKQTNIKNIKWCVWHHFGGLGRDPYASTRHLTLKHIENAHRARYPGFLSRLNRSPVLYTWIIFADGSFVQTRYIGEETGATRGHNRDAVHGCFAGNFSRNPATGRLVDTPTDAQMATARLLGYEVFQLGVPLARFVPHRVLDPGHTECYGSILTDDWIRQEIGPAILKQLTRRLKIIQQILILMKKVHILQTRKVVTKFGASDTRECIGRMTYGEESKEN